MLAKKIHKNLQYHAKKKADIAIFPFIFFNRPHSILEKFVSIIADFQRFFNCFYTGKNRLEYTCFTGIPVCLRFILIMENTL